MPLPMTFCDLNGHFSCFKPVNGESYISRLLNYFKTIISHVCRVLVHWFITFEIFQGHVLLVHQRTCNLLGITGFLVALLSRPVKSNKTSSSVFCCCGPVDLEFAARQSSWPSS